MKVTVMVVLLLAFAVLLTEAGEEKSAEQERKLKNLRSFCRKNCGEKKVYPALCKLSCRRWHGGAPGAEEVAS
ncbi:unnamed protein product [Calicophoron daubneyi]|uniref:Uncharacterized protein n=1 Tax=Calicophoron daubneyi TaxID=300641 RepID=A0AAV2TKC1_CALDB